MSKPCIPTMSLGHGAAGHSMESKLKAARAAGFEGIEVFYPCLESFSQTLPGDTARDKLRNAAKETKKMCDELGLTIIVLQPVLNYDGIMDPKEHSERVEEIVFRFELCKLLGTDIIQIPANFRLDDGITGDKDKVVADLREIAALGLKVSPPIRFVYEAMCWSTFNYTWQQGWEIVQAVDLPNFGVVLDAFHIAGYEYADPTLPGGVRPDGKERLAKSLKELVATIPAERIFYTQLVDAERLDVPLGQGSTSPYYLEGQQPYMSWSRNCRVFPYETDRKGYMPIEDVAKAFLDTGFQGWVSFELFNRFINSANETIPTDHAQRGWKSWLRLKERLSL